MRLVSTMLSPAKLILAVLVVCLLVLTTLDLLDFDEGDASQRSNESRSRRARRGTGPKLMWNWFFPRDRHPTPTDVPADGLARQSSSIVEDRRCTTTEGDRAGSSSSSSSCNGDKVGGSGKTRRKSSSSRDDKDGRTDLPGKRHLSGSGGNTGKRARLAFLIMSSGSDIAKLHLLLPEIYHPDNIYLLHVDAKTPPDQVKSFREVVATNCPEINGLPSNCRLLEPAGIVSWGGFSLTLTALYGMAAALLWDSGWDYFINLSTADFPIVTQDEMRLFLGHFADSRINFLDGDLMTGFPKRWQGYAEDQGLQRDAEHHTTIAMTLLGQIDRPRPQRFNLYKGEFWHVLHRSFCEYVSWSPDNVARGLSAYFTGYRISDESYFQTLACHPEGRDFPIHGDNLRFLSWNEDHKDSEGRKVDAKGNILIHPEPLSVESIGKMKTSGALFARKFDYVASYQVYAAAQENLRDQKASKGRLDRLYARVGGDAIHITGRHQFCNAHKGSQPRGRRRLKTEPPPEENSESGGDESSSRERASAPATARKLSRRDGHDGDFGRGSAEFEGSSGAKNPRRRKGSGEGR